MFHFIFFFHFSVSGFNLFRTIFKIVFFFFFFYAENNKSRKSDTPIDIYKLQVTQL